MVIKNILTIEPIWGTNCIILFITKNHTVHWFNVCTRNIIQIGNHEYIYQIIAVRDSVPITYFHKSNFHVGKHINIYKCIIIINNRMNNPQITSSNSFFFSRLTKPMLPANPVNNWLYTVFSGTRRQREEAVHPPN